MNKKNDELNSNKREIFFFPADTVSCLMPVINDEELMRKYNISSRRLNDHMGGVWSYLRELLKKDEDFLRNLKVDRLIKDQNNFLQFEYSPENKLLVETVAQCIANQFERALQNKVNSMYESFINSSIDREFNSILNSISLEKNLTNKKVVKNNKLKV